jgi:hypothetical protein
MFLNELISLSFDELMKSECSVFDGMSILNCYQVKLRSSSSINQLVYFGAHYFV